MDNIANKIETNSYFVDVNIIPNPSEYQKDINENLAKDIKEIIETLIFLANIVEKKQKAVLDTNQNLKYKIDLLIIF